MSRPFMPSRSRSGARLPRHARPPRVPRVLMLSGAPACHEPAGASPELAGFRLDTVRNGAGLFRHLGCHRYDLVVLDVRTPGVDILAWVRALRRRPRLARLPILVSGRRIRPDIARRYLAAGVSALLALPLTSEALTRALPPRPRLPGHAGKKESRLTAILEAPLPAELSAIAGLNATAGYARQGTLPRYLIRLWHFTFQLENEARQLARALENQDAVAIRGSLGRLENQALEVGALLLAHDAACLKVALEHGVSPATRDALYATLANRLHRLDMDLRAAWHPGGATRRPPGQGRALSRKAA